MSPGETLHASCVAHGARGLLILGASGAGKSALALELIALGADLVADDRVALRRQGAAVIASAPPALCGLIEARGAGLLRMPFAAEAAVTLALDLDGAETARLPPRRTTLLLGAAVPVILCPVVLRPASILAVLRHGPPLDPDAPIAPRRHP
ncbi:MAG: serine kinase [Alphaproteobacteria bacterium]|nr:serine kinase [Alphaproteobacteria bacterium]